MHVLSDAGQLSPGATNFFAVVLLVFGFVLYMVPVIIVALRRSPNAGAVIVIDVFLGWTVIGWIVALAMAVSGPDGRRPKKVPQVPPYQWQQR